MFAPNINFFVTKDYTKDWVHYKCKPLKNCFHIKVMI